MFGLLPFFFKTDIDDKTDTDIQGEGYLGDTVGFISDPLHFTGCFDIDGYGYNSTKYFRTALEEDKGTHNDLIIAEVNDHSRAKGDGYISDNGQANHQFSGKGELHIQHWPGLAVGRDAKIG